MFSLAKTRLMEVVFLEPAYHYYKDGRTDDAIFREFNKAKPIKWVTFYGKLRGTKKWYLDEALILSKILKTPVNNLFRLKDEA